MSTTPIPVKLKDDKVRVALGDPDTPGLVLFTIALATFGDGLMGDPEQGVDALDPSEIWVGLNERFGTWVTEEGENKLNAIMAGLSGAAFWRDELVFMSVATALFDGDLGDLIEVGMEELSATELMWALLEMELAWDAEETPEFSRQIRNYIENCLRREQDEQLDNTREVEHAYLRMLQQLRDIGVPASMIRAWDEEFAAVMEEIEARDIS